MATKDPINDRLRAIAQRVSELTDAVDDNGEVKARKLNDAERVEIKALTQEGKDLKAQWDAREIATFARGSDGQSAVKRGFRQEVTDENDQEQEQRAQEASAKKDYASAFEGYLRLGSSMKALYPKAFRILSGGRIEDDEDTIKALKAFKAIGDGSATGGEFLVPEQFMAEVLKKEPGLIGLTDSVRHQQTSRDVLVWPRVIYTTDNQYTAPHRLVFTGPIPSSSTVHAVTDETFGEGRIPVNLAMASQPIANSLIEDSATDVMSLTAGLFRENIMQDIEYYFAQGTGSGQPEGIYVNATAQTNYVAGLGASTITSNGLKDTYWKLPAQYRRGAKWVFSSDTARQIAELQDGNGRYIWQEIDQYGGGLGAVQQDGSIMTQPRLLGCPVVVTEQAPSISTNTFPIVFGNLQGYIAADRVGMTVRVLDEILARTDQKLFLLRYRFGGQLVEDYKVKLTKIAAS